MGIKQSAACQKEINPDVRDNLSIGLSAKQNVAARFLKCHFRRCHRMIVHGKKNLYEVSLAEFRACYDLVKSKHITCITHE
jgi:hypothetical protein